MLVLSRKKNESIIIGDDVQVYIVEIRGDKVRLGIDAPLHIPVHRREVFDSIRREEIAKRHGINDEGRRRYPPEGRYCANDTPGTLCTCVKSCPTACKGKCGCEACSEAYGDYLSSQ